MMNDINSFLSKYIWPALIWVVTYFSPIKAFILMVGFFMLADMVLALSIVVRTSGWGGIESRQLWRTPAKIAAAGIFLMVALVMERQLLPSFPATQLIAGFLAMIELKSIDEKGHKIFGMSMLKFALEKLKVRNDNLKKDKSNDGSGQKAA